MSLGLSAGIVGAAGVIVDPGSFSDVIFQFDPDEDNITKDGSDRVSQWDDLTTEANNISQATGSEQPLWLASVATLNSMPAIQGAPTENLSRATFTGGAVANPSTQYWVVESQPNNPSGNEFISFGASGRNDLFIATGRAVAIFGGAQLTTVGTLSDGIGAIIKIEFDGVSSSIRVEPDGGSVFTASGNSGSTSMNGLTIGRDNASGSFTGKTAYGLCYDKLMPANEDAAILSFLRNKFMIITS